MSATLETPKAAQIAETHVTTEVAETIKSEVDPLQEEVSTSLWKIITSLELSSSRWLRSSGACTDHPDHRRQPLLNQAWAWPWRDSRNIGRSEEYRPKQEWWRWGWQCGWRPSGRLCGSWGGWRTRILFLWCNHSKGKLLVSTRMIKEILWFAFQKIDVKFYTRSSNLHTGSPAWTLSRSTWTQPFNFSTFGGNHSWSLTR